MHTSVYAPENSVYVQKHKTYSLFNANMFHYEISKSELILLLDGKSEVEEEKEMVVKVSTAGFPSHESMWGERKRRWKGGELSEGVEVPP